MVNVGPAEIKAIQDWPEMRSDKLPAIPRPTHNTAHRKVKFRWAKQRENFQSLDEKLIIYVGSACIYPACPSHLKWITMLVVIALKRLLAKVL